MSKKQVVVIAGPSGSGKNAIIEEIVARYPNCVRLVTATTRKPREGEKEGVDYHFFSVERFQKELAAGTIPEHRFVLQLGTHYGTYLPDLEEKLSSGKIVFAQVDVQGATGANMFKDRYHAVTIFVKPGSVEEFERRVRARNPSMTEDEIQKRMLIGEKEMEEFADKYDYQVVNADGKLNEAVEEVVAILKKEGYTLL